MLQDIVGCRKTFNLFFFEMGSVGHKQSAYHLIPNNQDKKQLA